MFEKLETPETLQKAVEFFADEDRCHAYLAQQRWPDGRVICPTCNTENPRWLAKQRRFECRKRHPKRQFSIKVGTIFEDSPIPLKSWLLAVWQITNCKNGISSYELARALGVTQKTAWFMNHRIRLAMQGDDGGTLDGEVEVDETYIGGKARNMNRKERADRLARNEGRKNSWAGKVAVLVCCSVIPSAASRKSAHCRLTTSRPTACAPTLRSALRTDHSALAADAPCRHPSALYAVAVTAEKLAALHESGAWTDEKAAQIETYVRPHLESVLNVADSDDSTLLAALDNLARAYTQVRPLL